MKKVTSIEEYIENHENWSDLLNELRSILLSTELEETLKWSAPVYTINGKNVVGLGAFKHHAGIWFFNGVFLKDEQNKLVNAQEGKTKALRQWRFSENESVDKNLVKAYVLEAIENQKLGKEIKPVRNKKEVVLEGLLKDALLASRELKTAFEKLTPGKQREYVDHISSAKREATQINRLEKVKPMILEGKGLHDKYKNC
ncbi:YdeI/OmpD-associated family protein [Pseudofulvibacter geojedonensis]|uniref:YdeI family protein n=1 Tax=Pseudofulvibacter geojedonensis TaxID=1123758 RepID=A0ABW3HY62_9FLAO